MKYLLMFLIAVGTYSVASAQYDRDDYYNNRENGWHERHEQAERHERWERFEWRTREINNNFDQRIYQIENDYSLSPWQKRRMIHELNEQRQFQLAHLQREARRERWHEDNEGYGY